MQRKIVKTADGSTTIYIIDWDEHYHSIHGAIQEAKHVFIKHGLLFFIENFTETRPIVILEIGFGTGLNTFVTFLEAERLDVQIDYVGIEAYPITSKELQALNYTELLNPSKKRIFEKLHECPWEEKQTISSHFNLTKRKQFFKDIDAKEECHLIYFDAFGAQIQPELWTEAIFKKMYDALKPNGILVTYSAKGSVRRAMQAVGFLVEKLPGPPGKREMLRGMKHSANM